MNFTAKTADISIDSLEQLYSAPVKSSGHKVRVAAFSFFLIVSSINAEDYDFDHFASNGGHQTTELLDRSNKFVPNSLIYDVPVSFDQPLYRVFARQVSARWQRQESLDKLCDSFYANFIKGQMDVERFFPLFKNMAKELRNLKINYVFVDVSRKKNMIDFNLSLDEGLFLSVAQVLNEPMENVMFTIARNNKTIVIDEMPLKELVRKVADVESQLKSVPRS